MAGDTNAKSIKVNATVDQKKVHPVSINTSISVNAMPFCVVEYPPEAKQAIKTATDITSSQIFSRLKKDQENTFKPKKHKCNVSVSCPDTGAEFKFSGMQNCPSYIFSVSTVKRTDNIMASWATVNAMDLSIYKLNPDYDELMDVSKGGPLNSVIKDVFNFIISEKHLQHYKEYSDVEKFVKITHQINEANKQVFTSILSKSTKMGWDNLRDYIEMGADWKFVLARIASVLMANNGGFFNNIVRLAEDFQCVFIPNMTGGQPAGELRSKMYIMSNSKSIKVPSVSMNASLGSSGMYPIAAVAAKANNTTTDADAAKRTVGYSIYPKEGTNPSDIATILSVPGPPWFNCSGKQIEDTSDSSTSKDTQGTSVNIKTAQKKAKKRKKANKEALKVQGSIMEQWTKCAYYWQALGQTSVYLNSEFTKAEIGKYYSVKNEKGQQIFKGLLYSITHNISSELDSVSADTRLMFTHVRMKGANIPGIE